MKKILYSAFFCCLLACSLPNEGGISMPYETEFVIQAGLNTVETHFVTFQIPTQADYILGDNKNDIKSINPRYVRIIGLDGLPYDFIERVSVGVVVNEATQQALEIGYLEDISLNEDTQMELIPTLVDVKDYLLKNDFTLQVKFKLRDTPPFRLENNQLRIYFDAYTN